MTKIKKRILKIGFIALMPLIALLFTISNTYAWYVDYDGNIKSDNLSNIDNTSYTTSTDRSINIAKIYVGTGRSVSFKLDYFDNRSASGNGGIGFWYGDKDFNSNGSGWSIIFTNQRITLNEEVGNQTITYNNFVMPEDYLYIICGATFNIGTFDISECMVNKGSTVLPYEPYGKTYVDPETYNFNEFLLGSNYFKTGRAAIFQTNDNNYYDRKIYPTNMTCQYVIGESEIGKYLTGKEINLSLLTSDLLTNLSDVSGYQRGRFTHISLKPALDIQGTATYPPVQLKNLFVNIFAPGNTVDRISLWIGSLMELGGDATNNKRIEFTKDGDYFYINSAAYPEYAEQFVWDIDIQLRWDGSNFIGPSSGECLTNNAGALDRYDLGFESGKRIGYEDGKQAGYDNGFDVGYRGGYQAGLSEGARASFEDTGMRNLFETILSYPVNLVKNSLDFNFMGINIANVVMFIVSIGIVAFVLKKFL